MLGVLLLIASWYGPGFYGNHTACGQLLTPSVVGVAHKTLPCGTHVTLVHNGREVTLEVVDRGPYIPGREFDLTKPAKEMLDCPDLCGVEFKAVEGLVSR